jgi:hypothetical protein
MDRSTRELDVVQSRRRSVIFGRGSSRSRCRCSVRWCCRGRTYACTGRVCIQEESRLDSKFWAHCSSKHIDPKGAPCTWAPDGLRISACRAPCRSRLGLGVSRTLQKQFFYKKSSHILSSLCFKNGEKIAAISMDSWDKLLRRTLYKERTGELTHPRLPTGEQPPWPREPPSIARPCSWGLPWHRTRGYLRLYFLSSRFVAVLTRDGAYIDAHLGNESMHAQFFIHFSQLISDLSCVLAVSHTDLLAHAQKTKTYGAKGWRFTYI